MKRILIIDDEQMVVKSLKEGLKKYEKNLFVTDIAFDASSAMDLIRQNTYHIVVSDIRLPDKSGVEIFWELKKIQPACKFIAITAFSDPEVKEKVEKLGALKYLEKPFDFKEFEELILDCFEEKAFSDTDELTELIEFTTLLQLINMEKKSVIVWLTLGKKKGYVAFENGEIVDAKFGKLRGVEAANYLIMQNRGKVKIEKGKKVKEKTVDIPFMTLLLNAVKSKDDLNREKEENKTDKESKKTPEFCDLFKRLFVDFQKKYEGVEQFALLDKSTKKLVCFSDNNGKPASIFKNKLLPLWLKLEGFFRKKLKIGVNSFELFFDKKVFVLKNVKLFDSEFVFVVQLNKQINVVMVKQGLRKFLDNFYREFY